ncbi:5'-nucleotidase [Aeromicrobium alkaliterrae]|uniref:5'-nucleotidase n=1 Tax=Aeromicrobium alkaliterrae TaxID=302168 RepID=A0ABN2JSM7_9ACTN
MGDEPNLRKGASEVPYELEGRLVVGVASSALFDLGEADEVFRERGEDEYRKYQEAHLDDTLSEGVAFPFIKRLLSLNDLAAVDDPLIEVIVLSRNDPETGLRVMRSLQTHQLPITRAVFMQGRSPYAFMPAFSMTLFLSKERSDVREAISMGLPAGQVLGSPTEDTDGEDLRIAFDFDGVLASDESEKIMQESGLELFHQNEVEKVDTPMEAGMLRDFLKAINKIQDREDEEVHRDSSYRRRLHVAIVTARNAPSHERVVMTLKAWGVRVNDAFFLGGVEKRRVLQVLRPHIFFDDQLSHLDTASEAAPSVHVPFGVTNAPTTED